MELSSSNIKKIIIFLKIKLFLYFWKWNPALKYIHPEKISYLSGNGNSEKIPYIFSKESCFFISENGEPEKNPHISGKRNPKKNSGSNIPSSKNEKTHPEKNSCVSGNGTFLYFRRFLAKPENQKFLYFFL